MRREARSITAMLSVCLLGLAVAAAAQQTTTTETRNFEIISVHGNNVVVRGEKGVTQEVTVTDAFRLSVDGKPLTVAELKPGMKGTATITTTTTVKPVHVTEVRNGEVVQKTGNTLIVRGPKGLQMVSEGDIEKRGIRLMRNNQPAQLTDFRQGDRFTATIVTDGPPQILTEKEVQANIASAASTTAGGAVAGTAGTVAGGASAAPAAARKTLPKTAGMLPLVGVIGVASLLLGVALTAARRYRQSVQ